MKVKQKGSEDVTVSLFEGENGPQVTALIKILHVGVLEFWRQQFSLTRLGRRLEKQEMLLQSSWKILASGLPTTHSSTRCRCDHQNPLKPQTLQLFLAIVGNSGQVGLSSGDEVNSYAGLRTIQLAGKEEDKKIILLNGKPLDFQVVTIPKSSFTIHLLVHI